MMKRMILALALCAAPAAAQPPAAAPAAGRLCERGELALPARPRRRLLAAAADRRPQSRRLWPGRAEHARRRPADRLLLRLSDRLARSRASTAIWTPAPRSGPAATVQFARFASVCRTYAPLYRQATLGAIPRALAGEDLSADFNLAYGDVRAAWHYYLDHYNQGRPFVLIGHSQGTIHLDPPARRGDRERPGGGADAFGAADRLCGRGARGPGGRRQPAAHAALHPRRARPAASSPTCRSAPTARRPHGAAVGPRHPRRA